MTYLQQNYKFCPRCQSDLVLNEKEHKAECSKCDFIFYDNPAACATILVLDQDNKLLLSQRARDPQKGMWDLIGGFIDQNETAEEGALREAHEELGIKLKKLTYLGSTPDIYGNTLKKTLNLIYLIKISDEQKNNLKAQDDVALIKFFNLDDLPQKFAFDNVRVAIDLLKKLMKNKKVVVIGGGTGIYPVTSALKYIDGVEISTIVGVTDNGGSTGRIRDEFGFPPVGDLRQQLAALTKDESQEWIRKLLLYRFNKGKGLKGHNLGNLILTALQDMTDSTSEALQRATQIFRLEGNVIPASNQNLNLIVKYEDGSSKIGENYLNPESRVDKKVVGIEITPHATASQLAIKSIEEADFIVIGPGDIYGSLLPTLMPKGFRQAFGKSKAKIIYIANLMTRYLQTDNMSVADHLKLIEKEIAKRANFVVVNDDGISDQMLRIYAKDHEYPLVNDLKNDKRVIEASIVVKQKIEAQEHDDLKRSYLRHDDQKLLKILRKII